MWNVTKVQAYAILTFSILCEIAGSGCLAACHGFENKLFTLGTIVGYALAFYSFSKILHIINIAVGYATWTALGSILTALMSQFLFNDPISPIGWVAIIGLCVGVVGLNMFGTPPDEAAGEEVETC